ncbi:MAG: sugar phosphate isomerase/epimerase family protein [Candidatus Omnitrophota bacterium]
MYVSIREDILKAAGYNSIAEGLKNLGLNSVEVEFFRDYTVYKSGSWEKLQLTGDNAAPVIAGAFGSAEIKICAFLLHNNFNCADQVGEINWVIDVVKTADKLQIPAIRIDAITKGEQEESFEIRINRFVECMKKIILETEGSRVQLGIENHGVQGNDPAFLKEVIERVGDSRLGVNMDTGNFYWYGNPLDKVYEILEFVAKYTKHTHVKNIRYPEETRNQKREIGWEYGKYVSPIYEGDIDHGKVIRILKEAGYNGPLTIEDESLGKFEPAVRKEVLKKDVNCLKNLFPVESFLTRKKIANCFAERKTKGKMKKKDLTAGVDKKTVKHRLFWTWDHSMDWVPLAFGIQESGCANPYLKGPEVFIQDYKRLIDFSARNNFTGITIYGFLRDIHGGVDAAKEICRYGRQKNVRIIPGIGVNSYGGVYWEGNHEFNLLNWLKKHPRLEAVRQKNSFWYDYPHMYSENPYLKIACPSKKENRQWMKDAVSWLCQTFDIGGINFETGDYGICSCEDCSRKSSRKNIWSAEDMAELLPPLINTALSIKPDILPLCECYFDNVLDPKAHSGLKALPPQSILQFCINRAYLDRFLKEMTPELTALLPPHDKVIRTHIGSQWNDAGRHLFVGRQYAQIIRKIAESGLDGFTVFSEPSDLYAVNEINYLSISRFSDNPDMSWAEFEKTHLASLIGPKEEVKKYIGLLEKKKITPADLDYVKKVLSKAEKKHSGRWAWLLWYLYQRLNR